MFDEPMRLQGLSPLASGTYRSIYPVPGRDDVMIKVMHPPVPNPRNRIRNFVKARSRFQLYRFLFREYDYYLRLKIQQEERGGPLPVSNLLGLVQTDIGLGMLVEKIGPRGDGVGLTVKALHEAGAFTEEHLGLLNDLIVQIHQWNMRVNDMNPGNIVLDEKGPKQRFVLVDGFGDSNFIPIKSYFDSLNKRGLEKRYRGLATYLQKTWNESAHRIE